MHGTTQVRGFCCIFQTLGAIQAMACGPRLGLRRAWHIPDRWGAPRTESRHFMWRSAVQGDLCYVATGPFDDGRASHQVHRQSYSAWPCRCRGDAEVKVDRGRCLLQGRTKPSSREMDRSSIREKFQMSHISMGNFSGVYLCLGVCFRKFMHDPLQLLLLVGWLRRHEFESLSDL